MSYDLTVVPRDKRWFFEQRPVISEREAFKIPFCVFKGHTRAVYGVGDADKLRNVTAPHGWYPVVDGRAHAFVVVWVNQLANTTVGSYNAVAFFVVVTRDEGCSLFPSDVERQPYSAILPALNPQYALFNLRYFVDDDPKSEEKTKNVLAYGTEILRLEKEKGSAFHFDFSKPAAFDSDLFKLTYPAPYRRDDASSERDRAREFFEISRLVGWKQTAQLMLQSKLDVSVFKTKLIIPLKNTISTWHSESLFDPAFSRLKKEDFEVKVLKPAEKDAADAEQGVENEPPRVNLSDIDFRAKIVGDDPNLMVAVYPEDLLEDVVEVRDYYRTVARKGEEVPPATKLELLASTSRTLKVENGQPPPIKAIVRGPDVIRAVCKGEEGKLEEMFRNR